MFWFYLLAYAFTIGMALNYRKEEVELEKTGTINTVKQDILKICTTDITYVHDLIFRYKLVLFTKVY